MYFTFALGGNCHIVPIQIPKISSLIGRCIEISSFKHNFGKRENRIVQKEIFEERYTPFPLEIARRKLREMGYGEPEVKPVPSFAPETDFENMDWYRIIAQKQ